MKSTQPTIWLEVNSEVFSSWILISYALSNAEEIVSLQLDPTKLQDISESVDKPISLVVLGHSNAARAILVNELIGGKPFFPVPVVSPSISLAIHPSTILIIADRRQKP